jgi:hypothetical protein
MDQESPDQQIFPRVALFDPAFPDPGFLVTYSLTHLAYETSFSSGARPNLSDQFGDSCNIGGQGIGTDEPSPRAPPAILVDTYNIIKTLSVLPRRRLKFLGAELAVLWAKEVKGRIITHGEDELVVFFLNTRAL